MKNYYAMSIPQLVEERNRLNHAGVHEIITDSDGTIIRETDHHYAGCTRCLIESIIEQKEMYQHLELNAHTSARSRTP